MTSSSLLVRFVRHRADRFWMLVSDASQPEGSGCMAVQNPDYFTAWAEFRADHAGEASPRRLLQSFSHLYDDGFF